MQQPIKKWQGHKTAYIEGYQPDSHLLTSFPRPEDGQMTSINSAQTNFEGNQQMCTKKLASNLLNIKSMPLRTGAGAHHTFLHSFLQHTVAFKNICATKSDLRMAKSFLPFIWLGTFNKLINLVQWYQTWQFFLGDTLYYVSQVQSLSSQKSRQNWQSVENSKPTMFNSERFKMQHMLSAATLFPTTCHFIWLPAAGSSWQYHQLKNTKNN